MLVTDHNTSAHLEVTIDEGNGSDTVRLKGRLNIDSSPEFRDRLLALLHTPSPKPVIIDLAEVSFIEASGIATLLEGLKVARHHGTTLSLKGLQGRPLHLFEFSGVLHLFELNHSGNSSSAKVS